MEKKDDLYLFFVTLFCVLVIVSNLITVKLFPAPFFPGIGLPAGMITFPIIFMMSDLTTELFGKQKARHMVHMGLLMSVLAMGIFQMALMMPAFEQEVSSAFNTVYSLNVLVVLGSLIAYTISQNIDIKLYQWIRGITGEKHLWLRTNGSTLLSQIIDTVIVNFFQFSLAMKLNTSLVLSIMCFDYAYKAFFSLLFTPLFYAAVFSAKRWVRCST